MFLGEQRGLGHCMLDPCTTGFSSFSLGMQLSPAGCPPVRGPQDTKLGLAMGELDTREPETLQQVSALWTRAGLTERLGPVHSGHPSGPQVEVLLPPVPTWVSGGRRETGLSFPPPAQTMTKASSQKWEQGGQSESWFS